MTAPVTDTEHLRPGADLRLLLVAGVAWAGAAWALTWPTRWVVGGAATGLLCSLACAAGSHWEWSTPGRTGRFGGRGNGWRTAALVLAGLACVLTACAGHRLTHTAGPVPELAAQHATVQVQGVVTSDPRQVGTGRFGSKLVVASVSVRRITGRGITADPHTPVLVMGDSRLSAVHWGDRVAITGRLSPLARQDDQVAVLDPLGRPRILAGGGATARVTNTLRAGLRRTAAVLPADPRGLVPALVVGDTSRVPAGLADDMRATGMTHLLAVSGSNVTLLMVAMMWLLGMLRVPGRARIPAVLALIAGYVALCRPDPSVVRAAVMGAVGLIGLAMARRRTGTAALGAAMIVLLVLDPWLARSYGFALSVLATAGLLLFARPWGDRIARWLPDRLAPLGEAIAIPVAAQALCAPVIVMLQGSVSVVGVLANLLAAPLVGPATVAGVLATLTAPLPASLAWLVAWCAGVPAWVIAAIAHCCAAVPYGSLPWPSSAAGALALAVTLVLLILAWPWLLRATARAPWLVAAVALLPLAAAWPTGSVGWPPPGWAYVACDVGQGDGGVVATTSGHGVLIDTGPDDAHIDGCLDRLGIRVLDAIVLTHYHADHVGGLAGALHGRTAREIFVTPVTQGDSGHADAEPADAPMVRRIAASRGIPIRALHTGDVLRWPGVVARVLWPSHPIYAGSIQNNASVVLDLRTRGLRMLFSGDIEREAAAQVLAELRGQPTGPPFDVLKVAHHGSSNQDDDLVQRVHATIAVISVGADNDYGHPSPRTLSLLRRSGSRVLRTDRLGDIAIVPTRPGVAVTTRHG